MNLRELRKAYPDLFHPHQDWFADEPFMETLHSRETLGQPHAVVTEADPLDVNLVPAVTLAHLYVQDPTAPIWRDYLWTSSIDRQGQRVYVGGTANGKGFEIHRHLHITGRWGVPLW